MSANIVETHQTGTRSLIRLGAVAAVWVILCYLILSVLVTRLLPSESLDPWPLGNVVAAMVALYAPVAVAAWLLVRLRHLSTATQLISHVGAAVAILLLSLLPFGA